MLVLRAGSVPARCLSWMSTALGMGFEAATATWATWRISWTTPRTACWLTPCCYITAMLSVPHISMETGTQALSWQNNFGQGVVYHIRLKRLIPSYPKCVGLPATVLIFSVVGHSFWTALFYFELVKKKKTEQVMIICEVLQSSTIWPFLVFPVFHFYLMGVRKSLWLVKYKFIIHTEDCLHEVSYYWW